MLGLGSVPSSSRREGLIFLCFVSVVSASAYVCDEKRWLVGVADNITSNSGRQFWEISNGRQRISGRTDALRMRTTSPSMRVFKTRLILGLIG